MLPELDEVSRDPEFSVLSGDGTARKIRQYMSSMLSATLAISGAKLSIYTLTSQEGGGAKEGYGIEEEGSGAVLEYKTNVLLDATVIQILCCSQVS